MALTVLQSNIRTADLTPMLGADRPSLAPVNPDGGRPVNVLVMGSDSREGENGFIGGGTEAGAKSDTTLVVHLAADRSWASAVSIPRDSVVEVPDCIDPATGAVSPGSRRIFNDAFTTGGPACTLKTVESLTGVRIDDWVVVDFAGFTDVVDALGTVPICLSEPVNDTKHNIHLPAGRSDVDGQTALAYVRERYTLGDGGDLGRIQRQQAFLSSVLQKATSAGTLANPARTYAFLDAVTRSLLMNPELSSLTRLGRARPGRAARRPEEHPVPHRAQRSGSQRRQPAGLGRSGRRAVDGPAPRPPHRPGLRRRGRDAVPLAASPSPEPSPSPAPSSSPHRPPRPHRPPSPSAPSQVVLDGVQWRSADTDICS